MLVILALIILVIFDMWTLHEMRKHETAICELLKLHPELLEGEDET